MVHNLSSWKAKVFFLHYCCYGSKRNRKYEREDWHPDIKPSIAPQNHLLFQQKCSIFDNLTTGWQTILCWVRPDSAPAHRVRTVTQLQKQTQTEHSHLPHATCFLSSEYLHEIRVMPLLTSNTCEHLNPKRQPHLQTFPHAHSNKDRGRIAPWTLVINHTTSKWEHSLL